MLANNGLDIKLRSSILYQPVAPEAYQLVTQTGADYYSTLVAPYVTSSARKVVGRYSPEEIYSSKREQIEHEIRDEVSQKLAGKHVQVNAVLIREVHLPPAVQTAIQTKLEEEQKALEMQFVLERTKQEAVRKHIEATEKLAESPNSKVVIVGSGKDGLPVILNTASAISPQVASRKRREGN